MKKSTYLLALLCSIGVFAQEHYSGMSTSNRVGLLNISNNPAELPNLSKRFEVNIYSLSFNLTNNKIGFNDIISGNNLEELIFKGANPVNMSFNTEILGPGFGIKIKKWGFGLSTKANARFDLVDVDTKLGDVLSNGVVNIIGSSTISNNYNQRMNGVAWGEVGISAARTLYNTKNHKFNVGVTVKLLFPGAFSNIGLDSFQGTLSNVGNQAYLHSTNARLNIAYSGNLAESYTNVNDYTSSIFGNLNGLATDIGINYQWKNGTNNYRLNAGIAIRNMGSLTFKGSQNKSSNYNLNIPQATPSNPGLNLNQFNNTEGIKDIETILLNSGYLTLSNSNADYKIKLPTQIAGNIDIKIVPKLYASIHILQKINSSNNDDQIVSPNIISITPRLNLGFFEAFSTWSDHEISGINGGVGFRLGGFYLGSNSIVTALINNSKQADLYTGFRWAFL